MTAQDERKILGATIRDRLRRVEERKSGAYPATVVEWIGDHRYYSIKIPNYARRGFLALDSEGWRIGFLDSGIRGRSVPLYADAEDAFLNDPAYAIPAIADALQLFLTATLRIDLIRRLQGGNR